jgi:hypothetical protein
MDLHKNIQREKLSAQTLDIKNTGRSVLQPRLGNPMSADDGERGHRFGPYSVREALEFLIFFDHFDSVRSRLHSAD